MKGFDCDHRAMQQFDGIVCRYNGQGFELPVTWVADCPQKVRQGCS
jgi:hypothetical protein